MSFVSKTAKIQAKIAALQAQLAELAASGEVDPATIVAGATVDYKYGKSKTDAKELTGLVVAVKPGIPGQKGSATQIKIAQGEGFDATFHVVYVSAIVKVHGAEPTAEVVAEVSADAVPLA